MSRLFQEREVGRMAETKVIHVMADGTIRNSVEGVMVPTSNITAYSLLAKYSVKKSKPKRSCEQVLQKA